MINRSMNNSTTGGRQKADPPKAEINISPLDLGSSIFVTCHCGHKGSMSPTLQGFLVSRSPKPGSSWVQCQLCGATLLADLTDKLYEIKTQM